MGVADPERPSGSYDARVRITTAELAALTRTRHDPRADHLEPGPGELLAVFVPGTLLVPANASAWIWQKRKRYADGWRERTAAALWRDGRLRVAPLPAGPKHVAFLALTHNTLDDDNVAGALKYVRDALVQCGVLTGDAPKDGNVFVYAQRIDRARRGVEIRVSAGGAVL